MFILEGADGVGKSTLAAAIEGLMGGIDEGAAARSGSLERNWVVHPFGVPKAPPIEEYLHWLVDHPNDELICDRFHLGENVYGPRWRERALTIQEQAVIELTLIMRGALLVHVTGDEVEVAEALRARGDELVAPEEVGELLRDFGQACWGSMLPLVTVNRWTDDRSETYINLLDHHVPLIRRARHYRLAFPERPGIGCTHDAALAVVGECPNPRTRAQTRDVPFAVGPAGQHLYEGLHGLRDFDWGRLYVTNAVKADGDRRRIAQELRFVRPELVLALGKRASAALSEAEVAHVTAVHPQHARRFHWNTMDYTTHLNEVLNLEPRIGT